ncbi:hypothetical protein SAMN02983003_3060 [Devosia enhydra]|uniref:Uncharacterized protein n=1 Tax=Devosia enhydra TaxID=665118 RepID=A0A1K2I0P2_9HYPH|nr:hypothetical protein [Devosia enhydra]SFZ85888.1 hypothetical protein SAMN02983003_3060 [Devosia enhydra]
MTDVTEGEAPAPAAAVDWAAVRAEYEAGEELVREIIVRHGITRSQLDWRSRREAWATRQRGVRVDRGAMVGRLFRLLDRQTLAMEKMMSDEPDREMAALGKLVTTLEKLIEIDERTARKAPRRQSVDAEGLRRKLAERIDRLVKD